MNQELRKFIEFCLVDGVISDKEREVILRKSRELGVPEDECEIIMDGLSTQKASILKDNKEIFENSSNTTSTLSKDFIEEISILDFDILIQIINFIKGVELELGRVMDPEFINEKFQSWYSDLRNNLVKKGPNSTNSMEVHFKNEKTAWLHFSFPDRSVRVKLSELLGIDNRSIIGLVKHDPNTITLFLLDSFIDVSISSKSNFFVGTTYTWNLLKSTKLEELNILDFNNTDLGKQLSTLLNVFDRHVNYNEGLVEIVNTLNITYDPANCLKYVSVKSLFGDDVVIKLSNHIRTIVHEVNSFASNLDSADLRPIGNYWGVRGFEKECFQNINYILLMLKNISGFIQIRNELLIAVLKQDRGRILLITEQLDTLGIMMNYYQKNQLGKMDKTIRVLSNGLEQLCGFVSELSNSVDNLNISLNNDLSIIKESIKFNSLLSVIQTYQVYKINKNTKFLEK